MLTRNNFRSVVRICSQNLLNRHLCPEKRSQVIVLSALRNYRLHLKRGLNWSKASKSDINTNLYFKLRIIRTQLLPLKKFSVRFRNRVYLKGVIFQMFLRGSNIDEIWETVGRGAAQTVRTKWRIWGSLFIEPSINHTGMGPVCTNTSHTS